jgi:hypothetical protein
LHVTLSRFAAEHTLKRLDDFMVRLASARAASTHVGSLSVVSACSGVLVVASRTRQVWRFDASNMFAGPTVLRQKV